MAEKRRTSTKKESAKKQEKKTDNKRQIKSVVWFAVSIFLLCVVFIKGEKLWLDLHNLIFGIFGVTAYVWPFFSAVIAVVYAMNKIKKSTIIKLAELALLILFIGSAIDIFASNNEAATVSANISAAFKNGPALKSAGALGALFAAPICAGFGKTGAVITIFLLIFVTFMVLTGTTLMSLFKVFEKPAKRVSEKAQNAYRKHRQDDEVEGRFDVDVSVDSIPEKREREEVPLDEKQRKVVATYHDNPNATIDDSEYPEGHEDDEQIDEALANAEKETKPKKLKNVDIEKETELVADEIELNEADDEGYVFPPLELLKASKNNSAAAAGSEVTAEHLVETLRSFGVETRVVNISRGPTVTRYELQPCAGVKISKITNLADDIALNLAAAGVRIEAPIPNKAAVGIEVPNKSSDVVDVRGILESPAFTGAKSKLTIALGRDIGGNAIVADIGKMPHGLIAGATNSGKSVCINSIIISLLYKASPDEVKFLMIDPKVVELGTYNGIPHLLVPVVTDPRKAAGALGWAVSEMEKRYTMFADRSVRNIDGYNNFVETLNDPEIEKMPHIVIIIDELADLMMTASHEVEEAINRITAKARAAGIHLIVATQRPSVDVVTGVIKANIPTRIAFAVASQVDSRTILDSAGAEKLLGRGDMLFSPVGSNKPNRIQGCYVSDEEIEAVVNFVKGDHTAQYDDNIMVEIERNAAIEKKQKTGLAEDGPDEDPMLSEAIKVVVENGLASTSLLQRKLKLGYARAARIIDEMEQRGVVGGYEGSKPRKVLITAEQLMEREAQGDD